MANHPAAVLVHAASIPPGRTPGLTWVKPARAWDNGVGWYEHNRPMPLAALKPHLLITGPPGSGKTTAIRSVAARLPNVRLGGFYTEELRAPGERLGFRLVAFGGAAEIIAHVDLPKTRRVGKYGVDVALLDRAAEAALAPGADVEMYLVDEIGKMECLSARFVALMRRLLEGRTPLVAAVALRGEGLIAEVKRRADCELWTLTRENRDALPARVLDWLAERRRA